MANLYQRIVLPGIVFQCVVIAGGYGTGRELVEFFLSQGPLGGIIGMVVALLIWGVVCMATFEFARVFKAYDYRTLFKELLGRGWFLFEIAYFIFSLLVLAIVAAASGSIIQETLNIPYLAGVGATLLLISLIAVGGNQFIEKFFTLWSTLLTGSFILFLIFSINAFGNEIFSVLSGDSITNLSGNLLSGVKYAGYNLAVIPAVLFTIRYQSSRKDSLVSGLGAGFLGMLPGALLYLSLLAVYPSVLESTVPTNTLLSALNLPLFAVFYNVILLGTLIQTGVGLIHAINERVSVMASEKGRSFSKWQRGGIAFLALLISAFVARLGLVDLIAKGYGTLTWVLIAVYVIPILTIGVIKIKQAGR